MRRRSFLKSLLPGTAAVASIGSLKQSVSSHDAEVSDIPHFQIDEGLEGAQYPHPEGIGIGVAAIDKRTNGFFPGQLVAIYGPIEEINLSLLMSLIDYATLKQSKTIDYLETDSDFCRKNLPLMHKPNVLKEIMPFLRFPDLDIGNPNNLGWKNYLSTVHKNPPALIIADGVESIEMFLGERKMAKQLKNLAVELGIPIVVKAPLRNLKDKTTAHVRSDFESHCEVLLRLIPQFVCDQLNGKTISKYYSLKANLFSDPRSKHGAYWSEFTMQFADRFFWLDGQSFRYPTFRETTAGTIVPVS